MISVETSEATRPRLVAPPGWAVSAAELLLPGRAASVRITQIDLPPGESLEALADREGERLGAELSGYQEQSRERRSTRAGEVYVRRYRAGANGAVRGAVQVIAPNGVVATVEADAAGELPDEIVGAAAEAAATFTFGAPRGSSDAYSVEELTALAELGGGSSFPGTGEHAFESDRERGAALRALRARGTVRPGDGGAPTLDPRDERVVQTVLHPVAVMDVEVEGQNGSRRSLLYAGRDLVVAHSATAEGVHRLEPLPAVLLPVVLKTLAGVAGVEVTAGSVGHVRVVTGSGAERTVTWDRADSAPDVGRRLDELASVAEPGAGG